jgi:predicted RNase H-like HicB family nuclease
LELYDLRTQIEQLDDSSGYRYVASSPDLPNLIVLGDSAKEVLAEAPRVASALIGSMRAAGDPLPQSLQPIPSLPFVSHVTVAVPA